MARVFPFLRATNEIFKCRGIKIVSQCLPYIGYPRSLNALKCVDVASKEFIK